MGGVAGHMSHLYDNPNITFGKVKEILEAASNGELEAEEKVDGQNLFLSYSIPEGVAKGARNKGNLKDGGLDAAGLATKFAGRGNIEKTFNSGFAAFANAAEALSDEEKQAIFGPNANIWYNAEIMNPGTPGNPEDPGSTNVIKYDGKVLKIHDVGHFLYDVETGEQKPIPKGALETLDAAVERIQKSLEDADFRLVRRAAIQLNKLEDDEALHIAKSKINKAIGAEGLGDNNTIEDYMFERIRNGIDGDLSEIKREQLAKYLLKMEGNIGLRAIKKGLPPEDLQDITRIVDNKKMILLEAIQPIEEAIHDFTVEILKGLESRFIVDNEAEVKRLQKELAKAVRSIVASGNQNPEAMAIMQRHLNKIKDFSNINTPMEGIVFQYDGHTYKFTGNFAPLNQILGMFRYPRGGTTLSTDEPDEPQNNTNESIFTSEPIIKEDEQKLKREKAEKFVLSLPKFSPSEAWGNPKSMERKQIQKIFDTVGGGATIEEKLQFLNNSIENPSGGIRSPRRIISTLIILESLAAVIRSFNSASAGFVFEGFLSALLRGRQEAEISEKGNLPIQDLIAFSELKSGQSVPISLKLLNQTTNIEGSYTNLIDALDEFGQMVYIVARKDKDKIALEKFTFNRDNFINAIVTSARGGSTNDADLLRLPGKTAFSSIRILNRLQGDENWPEKYELLQQTSGYRARKKKIPPPEEEVTVTDEMPDGEDVEAEIAANRTEKTTFTVEENKKLISEGLLAESFGTQWKISAPQLKYVADSVDYDTLGTLPISTEKIVDVAVQYIDKLSDNLRNVFESTKNLSEHINEYFTYQDRSQAINAGEEAISDSEVIGSEMREQLSQDQGVTESLIKEKVYTNNVTNDGPQDGKKIALFPGKFKPPHRGHYEFAKKMAKKLGNQGEVVVLISPSSKPEVSPEQSLKVWNKYLQSKDAPDNIQVEIADYRSPITSVYEFVADPVKARPGDTVLLIKSSKDEGDTRYNGAQSYAERNNPGVNVEIIEEDPVVRPDGEPYHGSDARKSISNNDKNLFNTFMPTQVDTDEVWSIFYPNQKLDTMIDEISTMGGGAVAGAGSGFGPPNTYNPYTKGTTRHHRRPKVKRAKRQKRK